MHEVTTTPTEDEVARVMALTLDHWGVQDRQRQEDRNGLKHLIEQRYPDFEDRMRGLATRMRAAVAHSVPLGQPAFAAWNKQLQDDVRELMPFLTEEVLEQLVDWLFADLVASSLEHENGSAVSDTECASYQGLRTAPGKRRAVDRPLCRSDEFPDGAPGDT